MRKLRAYIGVLAFLLFLPLVAAQASVSHLTEAEFRALAGELSQKVNLFRTVWKEDPEAEFYGGTSRDFLYWVKGQFREAGSREAALATAAKLRELEHIDVKQFIARGSDVDILAKKHHSIDPRNYGVRAIDTKTGDFLDPKTEVGRDERMQGFIPAEKIRLGNTGLVAPTDFGDGVGEIYRGKLSISFPDKALFAQTKRAIAGTNHEILLAFRFLRLHSQNYFHVHGSAYPNKDTLLKSIPPDIETKIRALMDEAADGKSLKKPLENEKFAYFLNGVMQKAYRSNKNTRATRMLFEHFGADKLPRLYKKVESLNQYLFAQNRDEEVLAEADRALRETAGHHSGFFTKVRDVFPDGMLYHGTESEQAFRSILFQGVFPSAGGSAGQGLYGVDVRNQSFAENWRGATKARLVGFHVKPDARIVDITRGTGKKIWEAFKKKHGEDLDKFALTYAIDILSYPYEPTAYVVKNSEALGKANGVYRSLLPLPDLLERVVGVRSPTDVLELAMINSLNSEEENLLWKSSATSTDELLQIFDSPDKLKAALESSAPETKARLVKLYYASPSRPPLSPEIIRALLPSLVTEYHPETSKALVALVQGGLVFDREQTGHLIAYLKLLHDRASFGDDATDLITSFGKNFKSALSDWSAVDFVKYMEENPPSLRVDRLSFHFAVTDPLAKQELARFVFATAKANKFGNTVSDRLKHFAKSVARPELEAVVRKNIGSWRRENRQVAWALVKESGWDRETQAIALASLKRAGSAERERALFHLHSSLLSDDTSDDLFVWFLELARKGNHEDRSKSMWILSDIKNQDEKFIALIPELERMSLPPRRWYGIRPEHSPASNLYVSPEHFALQILQRLEKKGNPEAQLALLRRILDPRTTELTKLVSIGNGSPMHSETTKRLLAAYRSHDSREQHVASRLIDFIREKNEAFAAEMDRELGPRKPPEPPRRRGPFGCLDHYRQLRALLVN